MPRCAIFVIFVINYIIKNHKRKFREHDKFSHLLSLFVNKLKILIVNIENVIKYSNNTKIIKIAGKFDRIVRRTVN